MPRTSTERPAHRRSTGTSSVIRMEDYGAPPDLTVLEFCAGMALARGGPMTASAVAAEVSGWLGEPLRSGALRAQLGALVGRGWAKVETGTYSLMEAGTEGLRGFYSALVRMLDGGRRLLDLAIFLSLIKEFERSGS